MRNAYKMLVGKTEGKDNLEDPGENGSIILEWIREKYGGKMWTRLILIRIERMTW
jgi:hypothetical protein